MTLPGGFFAGQLLQNRYELRHYVAGGGMGMVYRGWDTVLERDVALKRVTFTGQSSEEEADNRARTLREARLGAHLGAHPHIISIYDRQEIDGDVWLVMEYLESLSLAQLTTDGNRLDSGEAARIGAAVAEALAHAHAKGITHRDVKPANILLSPDHRQVKLADFGIAHRDHDPSLTATNVVTGTIAYMPREVARGDTPGDPQADIYSLGATLYEIVEGDTPHGRDTNAKRLLIRAAHEPPRTPQHAGPFGPLLQQMLALDPSTRPTAHGAHRLLRDFAQRHHKPTNPKTTVVGPGDCHLSLSAKRIGRPNRARSYLGRLLRPGRFTRAIIGIALVLALVAAVTASVMGQQDSGDPLTLPERVDHPITLTGDPVSADPCALLDPAAMSRFGSAFMGPGSDVGECRLTNIDATQSTVFTGIHYGNSRSEISSTRGAGQDLGGVTIKRQGLTSVGCSSTIMFPDSNLVRIDTKPRKSAALPIHCETNEAALAIALVRLMKNGVTYSPQWRTWGGVPRRNACELSVEARTIVPTLNTSALGYPNGSRCYHGYSGYTQKLPYVFVKLGLEPYGNVDGYGQRSEEDGKMIFTSATTPQRGRPGQACAVFVVHRLSVDGGASRSRPTEWVQAQVEGPDPYDLRCRQATTLAIAIEKRLE